MTSKSISKKQTDVAVKRSQNVSKRPLQTKHATGNELGRAKPVRLTKTVEGGFAFTNGNKGTPEDYASLKETTGASNAQAAASIVMSMLNIAGGKSLQDDEASSQMMTSLMHSLDPQDAVEGMLCAQMIATQHWIGTCGLRGAVPANDYDTKQDYLRNMQKFMSLSLRQIEALGKYRNKGNQTVTVQHVTVNDGGKAVVGVKHDK